MSIRLSGRSTKFIEKDRVRTKTGRTGRIIHVWGDTVRVEWDNGECFSIRDTHLTLIEDHDKTQY